MKFILACLLVLAVFIPTINGDNMLRSHNEIDNTDTWTTNLDDPEPTGGAPCNRDSDCGGINGGQCIDYGDNGTTVDNHDGYCECYEDRGDPDCSYERKNKDLAGGLQFLCFVGIGGVGEFYLGNTAEGVGQLLLLISWLAICILACVALCCMIADSDVTDICGGAIFCVGGCLLCCTSLAGFIWCIIRAVQMFSGEVTDGNGYALY